MAGIRVELNRMNPLVGGFMANVRSMLWYASIVLPIMERFKVPPPTVEALADRVFTHINLPNKEKTVEKEFAELKDRIEKDPESLSEEVEEIYLKVKEVVAERKLVKFARRVLNDLDKSPELSKTVEKEFAELKKMRKENPEGRSEEVEEMYERIRDIVLERRLINVADDVLNHLKSRLALSDAEKILNDFMDTIECDDYFYNVLDQVPELRNEMGAYRSPKGLEMLEKDLLRQIDSLISKLNEGELDQISYREQRDHLEQKGLVIEQNKKLLKKVFQIRNAVSELRQKEMDHNMTACELLTEMEKLVGQKLDGKDLKESYARFHGIVEKEMANLEFHFPAIRNSNGIFVPPQNFEIQELAFHKKINLISKQLNDKAMDPKQRGGLIAEKKSMFEGLKLLEVKRGRLYRIAHVEKQMAAVRTEVKLEPVLSKPISRDEVARQGLLKIASFTGKRNESADFELELNKLLGSLRDDLNLLADDEGLFLEPKAKRVTLLAEVDRYNQLLDTADLEMDSKEYLMRYMQVVLKQFSINEKHSKAVEKLAEISELYRHFQALKPVEAEESLGDFIETDEPAPVKKTVKRNDTPKLTKDQKKLIDNITKVVGPELLQGNENNFNRAYAIFQEYAARKRKAHEEELQESIGTPDREEAEAELGLRQFLNPMKIEKSDSEEEREQFEANIKVDAYELTRIEEAEKEIATFKAIESAYQKIAKPVVKKQQVEVELPKEPSEAMMDLLDHYEERPLAPLPPKQTEIGEKIQAAIQDASEGKTSPVLKKPPELKLKAAPWKPQSATVTV